MCNKILLISRSSEAEVVPDGIQNETVVVSSNLEKDMVNESKENERKIQDERKTQELKRKEQDAEGMYLKLFLQFFEMTSCTFFHKFGNFQKGMEVSG